MSEEEADKILKNYFKTTLYLDCVEYLLRMKIPVEYWPPEYQTMANASNILLEGN